MENEENKQPERAVTDSAPMAEKKQEPTPRRAGPQPFTGSYAHTMDAKGRMVVPGEFRELLGETFYVCPSPDFSTIAIYTEEKWNERNELYLYVSEHSAMLDDDIKWFSSLSFKMRDFDTQGRILLPAILRQRYLGDDRDISINGAQTYISVTTGSANTREFNNFRATRGDAVKNELSRWKAEFAEKKKNGEL